MYACCCKQLVSYMLAMRSVCMANVASAGGQLYDGMKQKMEQLMTINIATFLHASTCTWRRDVEEMRKAERRLSGRMVAFCLLWIFLSAVLSLLSPRASGETESPRKKLCTERPAECAFVLFDRVFICHRLYFRKAATTQLTTNSFSQALIVVDIVFV